MLLKDNKKDKFPESLKEGIVGVMRNTTNEEVGEYLMGDYGYDLRGYGSVSDLYNALDRREIDYALIDDVMVVSNLGTKFFRYGPNLTGQLKDFYNEVFQRADEMFAIAVAPRTANSEDNILDYLNDLLSSVEGQRKLKDLEVKWGVTETQKPMGQD